MKAWLSKHWLALCILAAVASSVLYGARRYLIHKDFTILHDPTIAVSEAIRACEWGKPFLFVFSNNVFDPFIYYSHLIPFALSAFIGMYVIFKNPRDTPARILFSVTLLFSLWCLFDLILWATDDPSHTMFFWSLLVLIEPFIYALLAYFVFLFVLERDVPTRHKILAALPLIPTILFAFTPYALTSFDLTNCDREAMEGVVAHYGYAIEFLYALVLLVFSATHYVRANDTSEKQKIAVVTIGTLLFFFSFAWGNVSGSLSDDWRVAQWGLFGMPVFIAFLAYLIVKYQVFSIKIIAAQALVATLLFITLTQYIFAPSGAAIILVTISVILSAFFGYLLIRSVKIEIQQRLEIEHLSEEKSEFMTFASHEIRNPITAMRGYASLILEGAAGDASPVAKETAKKILVIGDDVLNLISQFLNASKIELGQISYTNAPFDAGAAVSAIVDGYVPHAEAAGLWLRKHIDPQHPLVVDADEGKLKEVIGNLIDNSMKYTKEGGVEVSTQRHGVAIRITVADTGVGIPADVLPKLFGKFTRADAAKANLLGTGVGLYLARTFIEGMGGRIWAESDGEGKGSRFIIEFPAASQH